MFCRSFFLIMLLCTLLGCVERSVTANLPQGQQAIFDSTQIIIETAADGTGVEVETLNFNSDDPPITLYAIVRNEVGNFVSNAEPVTGSLNGCLLYTSPSPRDRTRSRMPSSA